jgi:hypothetical protein
VNDQDPQLDPEQEALIRGLLADLGAAPDATMPPGVATRLDETLAELVAERAGASDDQTGDDKTGDNESRDNVVPLRRRWATRAAAVAAAVIVVGAGGVAAANLGVFGGSADDSSAGSASSKAESQDDSASPPSDSAGKPVAPGTGQLPALSAAAFETDAARLVKNSPLFVAGTVPNVQDQKRQADKQSEGALRTSGCNGPPITDGATPTLVLYDGQLAVLLVHPQHGDSRLVDAWNCAGTRKLDTARVPAVPVPTSGKTGKGGQSSPGSPGLASPAPSP